jgi:hypothetical protein
LPAVAFFPLHFQKQNPVDLYHFNRAARSLFAVLARPLAADMPDNPRSVRFAIM